MGMAGACSPAEGRAGATAAAIGALDGKYALAPLKAAAQMAMPAAINAQAKADDRRCGTAGALIGLPGRTTRRGCAAVGLIANRARSRLPCRPRRLSGWRSCIVTRGPGVRRWTRRRALAVTGIRRIWRP